jgi:hypothetical protein
MLEQGIAQNLSVRSYKLITACAMLHERQKFKL